MQSHREKILARRAEMLARRAEMLARRAEMLARFGHSAGRFIRHGAPTTPPEILAAREATCPAPNGTLKHSKEPGVARSVDAHVGKTAND